MVKGLALFCWWLKESIDTVFTLATCLKVHMMKSSTPRVTKEVVVGCCEEDGIRIKTSTQYNTRFQIRNNYVIVFSCSSSSCRYCVHVLYIYILWCNTFAMYIQLWSWSWGFDLWRHPPKNIQRLWMNGICPAKTTTMKLATRPSWNWPAWKTRELR